MWIGLILTLAAAVCRGDDDNADNVDVAGHMTMTGFKYCDGVGSRSRELTHEQCYNFCNYIIGRGVIRHNDNMSNFKRHCIHVTELNPVRDDFPQTGLSDVILGNCSPDGESSDNSATMKADRVRNLESCWRLCLATIDCVRWEFTLTYWDNGDANCILQSMESLKRFLLNDSAATRRQLTDDDHDDHDDDDDDEDDDLEHKIVVKNRTVADDEAVEKKSCVAPSIPRIGKCPNGERICAFHFPMRASSWKDDYSDLRLCAIKGRQLRYRTSEVTSEATHSESKPNCNCVPKASTTTTEAVDTTSTDPTRRTGSCVCRPKTTAAETATVVSTEPDTTAQVQAPATEISTTTVTTVASTVLTTLINEPTNAEDTTSKEKETTELSTSELVDPNTASNLTPAEAEAEISRSSGSP